MIVMIAKQSNERYDAILDDAFEGARVADGALDHCQRHLRDVGQLRVPRKFDLIALFTPSLSSSYCYDYNVSADRL
jgi:hypothetical protein